MAKYLNTIITLRNDDANNWLNQENRPLLKGEVGVEFLDEGKKARIKVGTKDNQAWSEAPYLGEGGNEVYQVATLDELPENADKGDIGIVSDGVNYTGYVFTGSNWAAMNGNYDATNVYLTEDVTLAGNFDKIGNYKKEDVIKEGTSLQEILSKMFQEELEPTVTYPEAEISVSGGSGEVGTSYTVPTATLEVTSVGSYQYGPETGIVFAPGYVKLAEGSDVESASNFTTNTVDMVVDSKITLKASGSTALYTDTSKSYVFSATAVHTDGAMPLTNLKNECADKQIEGGDIEVASKTATFSGYRYSFMGATSAASIESTVIRAASKKEKTKPTSSKPLELAAPKGATKIFYAYPSSWSGTPNFQIESLGWLDANNDFVSKPNVQVADARGTVDGVLQGAMEYKLYVWEMEEALKADTTNFRVFFK